MKLKEHNMDRFDKPTKSKIKKKSNSSKISKNDKRNKPQRRKRDKFMYS